LNFKPLDETIDRWCQDLSSVPAPCEFMIRQCLCLALLLRLP